MSTGTSTHNRLSFFLWEREDIFKIAGQGSPLPWHNALGFFCWGGVGCGGVG